MRPLVEALQVADRPHIPGRGDPRLPDYKEWWHFNVIDDASGADVIVNLSLGGDLFTPDKGQANLILLVHERGRGWSGGLKLFDGVAACVDPRRVDIALGSSALRCADRGYALALADTGGTVAVDLLLEPLAEPFMVWKDTPIGEGHVNWLIVPNLAASGEIRVGGRRIAVSGARAYHDHNWGRWRWGDNFGWDWGFCAAAADIGGEPLSLVYDKTVDRARSGVMEHSLALWRGPRLAKLFSRRMVTAGRSDRFAGEVRRIPGVSALIDQSRVTSVPQQLRFAARDGVDWIDARYEPDAAIQIAIPRETGFGLVELNETMGWLTAAGSLGGEPLTFRRRACFEFVR